MTRLQNSFEKSLVRRKRARRSRQRAARLVIVSGALLCVLGAARQIYKAAQGAAAFPAVKPSKATSKATAPPGASSRVVSRMATPKATAKITSGKATLTAKPNAIPHWAQGVSLRSVRTKEKVIALTFDDGPFPVYTHQVLDILRDNKIRATFFMIGCMVKEYPAIAREVRDAGHAIGNHSWSHSQKPKAPVAEVEKTAAILKQTVGETAPLFRPPYGLTRNGMAATAQKKNQTVVLWDSMGSDWDKKSSAARIEAQVLKFARPGGIVLLHDGGGDRSETVKALPRIIAKLQGQGYRFVTVPELLTLAENSNPKPEKIVKKTQNR